mgnify:CR=1 FL=1
MAEMTSRKTSRAQMATLLSAITTFVAVYDHEVKNFDGKSPVATVHSDGSMQTFPDYLREKHRFIVTLWWKRADDDATEDYIDDLAKNVRQKLYDNVGAAGYWHDIEFDEEYSQLDYVILDGEMYRRETIRVAVLVVGGA